MKNKISGLDKVNMMYGRLGFVEYDRSTKEMLESGCEIDQQSLSLLKLCWKVPLCLKSAVASVVGWYFNSQFLAEGVRIPIYAKYVDNSEKFQQRRFSCLAKNW